MQYTYSSSTLEQKRQNKEKSQGTWVCEPGRAHVCLWALWGVLKREFSNGGRIKLRASVSQHQALGHVLFFSVG